MILDHKLLQRQGGEEEKDMSDDSVRAGIDVDIVFAHKAEKAYAHGLGQFHRGQRRRARSHKQTHAADRGLFEHVHRQTPAEDHELALRGHALKLHGPYELVQSVVPGYVFIKQQNALRVRQGAAVGGPCLPKKRAAFFKGRLKTVHLGGVKPQVCLFCPGFWCRRRVKADEDASGGAKLEGRQGRGALALRRERWFGR